MKAQEKNNNQSFNYFSVNDWLWFRYEEHLISFGTKKLPSDIHYTLSFNANSPKINFHVTRNTSDKNNKPKISIFEFNKESAEKISQLLLIKLLQKFIIPFNLKEYRNSVRNKAIFLPYYEITEGKTASKMHKKLTGMFAPITKTKRRRYKIEGDIEALMLNIASSNEMLKETIRSSIPVKRVKGSNYDSGIIFSKNEIIPITKIDSLWHKIDLNIPPKELLHSLLNEKLATQIYRKLKIAIVRVRNANSYEEVKQYDKPIHLYIDRNK